MGDTQVTTGQSTPKLSVDYMLRTAMQHHIHLSTQADQKANIIIGTNSIIFSLAIGMINSKEPSWGLMSLCITSISALFFSVLTVIPSFKITGKTKIEEQKRGNLLFFGYFNQIPYEEYLKEMKTIIKDSDLMANEMIHDLYNLGVILSSKKYKHLATSYRIFLYGIIVSLTLTILQFLTTGIN